MKKILSMAAALLLAASCGMTAIAADSDPTVYVTIADADGNLALAREAVTVTDADADGALTINDALYCAHEAKYEGGAAAGYSSGMTEFGISMNKLWGAENGGSYGYYLNNASAWSLTDPVAEGDSVAAFVYTDLTAWSDTYCYFDTAVLTAEAGAEVVLTLSAAGYDENYNPITIPVADAEITVNGEASGVKTDAEGKAVLTLAEGTAVISAASETMTLVPPVCVAEVSAAPVVTSPQTGDGMIFVLSAAAAVTLAGVVLTKKKTYEK